MKYYQVFTLATLLLSGCSGFQLFQPSSTSTPNAILPTPIQDHIAFVQNMMSLHQCIYACWLGIEPGITDPTLVEEILKKQYGDENVVVLQKDQAGRNIIKWASGSSKITSYIGGVLIENNVVSSLDVYLGFRVIASK